MSEIPNHNHPLNSWLCNKRKTDVFTKNSKARGGNHGTIHLVYWIPSDLLQRIPELTLSHRYSTSDASASPHYGSIIDRLVRTQRLLRINSRLPHNNPIATAANPARKAPISNSNHKPLAFEPTQPPNERVPATPPPPPKDLKWTQISNGPVRHPYAETQIEGRFRDPKSTRGIRASCTLTSR